MNIGSAFNFVRKEGKSIGSALSLVRKERKEEGKSLAYGVLAGLTIACILDGSGTLALPKENRKSGKANLKKLQIDKSAVEGKYKEATAKRQFRKSNTALVQMAYNIQEPYVKEEKKIVDGKEYTVKTAKFNNDAQKSGFFETIHASFRNFEFGGDRYVRATYDDTGKLESVEINHNRRRRFYEPDVKYTRLAAYADTNHQRAGYETKITSGFDFETVSKLTETIFNKNSK